VDIETIGGREDAEHCRKASVDVPVIDPEAGVLDLVGPNQAQQSVPLKEATRRKAAEVAGAAPSVILAKEDLSIVARRRCGPKVDGGIRPQNVTHRSFRQRFVEAVDRRNIVKGLDVRREAPMQHQTPVVQHRSQRQRVERRHADIVHVLVVLVHAC